MARTSYEITAFSKLFLEKAFAHNEYSWQDNLTQVSSKKATLPSPPPLRTQRASFPALPSSNAKLSLGFSQASNVVAV